MTWTIQVCVLHPEQQVFEPDGCPVCNPRDREQTVVVQTTTVEVVSGKTALRAWEIADQANQDCEQAVAITNAALDRADEVIDRMESA